MILEVATQVKQIDTKITIFVFRCTCDYHGTGQANGHAEVCVSPGVTGNITATLSITLQINDSKAGKKVEFDVIIMPLITLIL